MPSSRTTRATLLATLVCAGVVMSGARLDEPLRAAPAARRVAAAGTLPLVFERAKAGVYTARSRGYDVRISSDEVVIALAGGEALSPARVRLSFAHAAPGFVAPEAANRASDPYLTARRARWAASLRTFGRVRLKAIHPGIDVVFFGTDRQLEYEIYAAPGSAVEDVAMTFDGTDSVGVDAAGDLVVGAAGRQLVLRRPAAFQEIAGTRVAVATEYAVRHQLARIVLGQYDRTQPLIIHPAP